MKLFYTVTLCLTWMLFGAILTSAQTTATSVIKGEVTDQTGAVVQGATVTLTRKATAQELKAKTDDRGRYAFYTLSPDFYDIKITAKGFTPALIEAQTELSKETTINATLELGIETNPPIQVTAGIESLLQTSDASIGSTFREQTMKLLPNITRQTNSLFFLQPGTTDTGEFAGGRQDQVTITLDGIDVSDKQNGSPSRTTIPVTVESIKEMRIAVANANATFLPASGGQIVMTTKSGGNAFNGSAYLYHQNNALAANSWTNNRTGIARPFHLDNRFGGTIGGPIVKDRTFFFLNFEGRRNPDSVTVTRIVPTAEYRRGIIRSSSNGAITTLDPNTIRQQDPRGLGPNPKMLEYLSLYPLPNDFSVGDRLNTAGFTFAAPTLLSNNIGVARLDHKFSDMWNVAAKFAADRQLQGCQFFPDTQGNNCQADLVNRSFGNRNSERPRNAIVSMVGVFSSHLTNEARFGWLQDRQGADSTPPQKLVGLDIPISLRLLMNDLVDYRSRDAVKNDTYQITDTLAWSKGSHSIQKGMNIRRLRAKQVSNLWGAGNLPFAEIGSSLGGTQNLTSILFGIVNRTYTNSSYDGNLQLQPVGSATGTNHRYNEWNFFFSDTWRWRPSLTATYGISYGWQSSPVEDTNRESMAVYKHSRNVLSFKQYIEDRRQAAELGVSLTPEIEFASLKQLGRKNAFNTDYSNLSPRFSIAWNPSVKKGLLRHLLGDQKTVVRGGYSLVFDRTNNATVLGLYGTDSGFSRSNSLRSPRNAAGAAFRIGIDTPIPALSSPTAIADPVAASGSYAFHIDPFIKTPRNHVVTFSIQRTLPKNFLVETGYIGRFARQLYVDGDLNALPIMHKDLRSGQTVAEAFDAVATALRSGLPVAPQPYFENIYGPRTTACFASNFRSDFLLGSIRHLFTGSLDQGGTFCGKNPNAPRLTNLFFNGVNYLYRHSAGYSNYHGLFVSLRKQALTGLVFEVNYSLSKSLDNAPLGAELAPSGSSQSNFIELQSPFFPDIDYAPSQFDIRHLISAHGVYELPLGKSKRLEAKSNMLNYLISGWFVSGIVTSRSGLPLTVGLPSFNSFGGGGFSSLSGAIPLGDSLFDPKVHKGVTGGANGVGSASSVTGLNLFANPAEVLKNFREILVSKDRRHGRNVLRGLGQWSFDWSVGKETRLYNRVNFKLSFDFINVFNHVNFEAPFLDKVYELELFGVLNTQANRPRRIQIGARIEF